MSEEKKRNFRCRTPRRDCTTPSDGPSRAPRRDCTTPSDGLSRASSVASRASQTSTDSRASSSSRTSSFSRTSNSSNTSNRRRKGPSKDRPQPQRSAMKAPLKEETREEEIALLNHRISLVPEIKLIISSNQAKIYLATFEANETYRLKVPIIKRLPPQLQATPDKPFNQNVVKNFNNKTKTNDKSLLFYFNLLVNDHHHLQVKAEEYKLYNMTKLLTTIEE